MIKVNEFTDVKYDVSDSIATITINRPDRYNALRGRTVDELLAAFKYAWVDNSVGAIILTGAGEKAFCSGGDQKERAATGGYGETETGMFEIESLHKLIRAVPKPVIAAVNGFAIGGGHVLHVLCDLSIAADTAKFGQVGPRVGSFMPVSVLLTLLVLLAKNARVKSGFSVNNMMLQPQNVGG